MQRFGWVALLTLGLSGCFSSSSERSAGNPLALIRKDADTVIEFRDIGMLVELRSVAGQRFAPALSSADLSALQDALALFLGFDPMTKDGLKSVGLAPRGAVVGELLADGAGAMWAIPVVDPKKFGPVLASAIETRWGADEKKTETVGGATMTTMSMEFGPHQAVRAAYGHRKKHMLVGFGPKAGDLVKAALTRAPTDTVENNSAFAAMRKRLKGAAPKADIQMIATRGGAQLATATKKVASGLSAPVRRLSDRVTTMGWVVHYDAGVTKVVGHLLLDKKGRSLAKRVLTSSNGAPVGVRAMHLPQALVTAQLAGDPRALLDAVAPVGSRARARMNTNVASLKRDYGIDLMTDVLPNLSGHGVFALGIDDLSLVDFETIVSVPESLVWGAFAASARDAKAIAQLESRLEGRLKDWQAKVVTRKVAGAEIRDIVPSDHPAGTGAGALFSTFTHAGAWGFSADPGIADAIAKNTAPEDRLADGPGLQVDVRFDRLNRDLTRFRMGQIPLLYRSLVGKALGYLSLLDRASMRMNRTDDGLLVQGELRLALSSR